jgi:hypothetical protein
MTKSSPSNYELLRLQRIQRNNDRLASLGLLDKRPLKSSQAIRTPPKKAARKIVSPSPKRVSRRLRNQPAPSSSALFDDPPRIQPKAVRRPRRIVEELTSSLTTEQKERISSKLANEDFLDKLQDFLLDVDKVSSANASRVIRAMTKLSSGQGVRAPQWPEDCYFLRGQKVGLTADVSELIERGRECEEEWGPDLGNGWLYNHPLRKLAMFQSYLLEEK